MIHHEGLHDPCQNKKVLTRVFTGTLFIRNFTFYARIKQFFKYAVFPLPEQVVGKALPEQEGAWRSVSF